MTDAQLEALIADVRPRPDAAWAARLDAKVARGFATPRPRRRKWWPGWQVPTLALGTACAIALLVVVGLAGRPSSGGNGSSSSSGETGGGGAAPPVEAAPAQKAPSHTSGGDRRLAVPAPTAPPFSANAPAQPRKVERAATLELTTPRDRVSAVADGIVRATEAARGFVASSNVTSGRDASASFDLRVPAASLSRTLSALSALAHVRSLNQSANDITDVVTAARARLRDREAKRASLRHQLAQATDPTTAARLERELRRESRRVEAARRALARQNSRAALSTVLVTVNGVRRSGGGTTGGGAWTPGDALHDAARVLEVATGVAVVALAVALPIGLLGGAAWAAVRVGTRRRRERLLDMA